MTACALGAAWRRSIARLGRGANPEQKPRGAAFSARMAVTIPSPLNAGPATTSGGGEGERSPSRLFMIGACKQQAAGAAPHAQGKRGKRRANQALDVAEVATSECTAKADASACGDSGPGDVSLDQKRATCLTGFLGVDYVLPIAELQQPSSAQRHPLYLVLQS